RWIRRNGTNAAHVSSALWRMHVTSLARVTQQIGTKVVAGRDGISVANGERSDPNCGSKGRHCGRTVAGETGNQRARSRGRAGKRTNVYARFIPWQCGVMHL